MSLGVTEKNVHPFQEEKVLGLEINVLFPLNRKKWIWIGNLTANGEVFSVPIESVYIIRRITDLKS